MGPLAPETDRMMDDDATAAIVQVCSSHLWGSKEIQTQVFFVICCAKYEAAAFREVDR